MQNPKLETRRKEYLTLHLARRIRQIPPSATLALNAKANHLKAQGVDVVNFGVGEPDFDTPAHIREAAIRAINEGFTRYTPVGGIPELKEAIIYRFKEDQGLAYKPGEIMVSCGGKHALYILFQVLFDQGDEVVVPAPAGGAYAGGRGHRGLCTCGGTVSCAIQGYGHQAVALMCYSLYLSTDSPADLRVYSTDLVRFQKAEDYEYNAASIINLLEFPNRWFVGSKSGCSCTFRHLSTAEPWFGAPEDWYPEEQVDLDATRQLYDVILTLLGSGQRVDCIDTWAGAEPRDIKTTPVSLEAVTREAFRLFEAHRFVFDQ